jgi:hypothetical protein
MNKLLICENRYLKNTKLDVITYNEILKLSTFGASQKINPLDRTRTIVPPYNFEIQFPLPTYNKTSYTYGELCLLRAKELNNLSEKLQCKIILMYSGGIDSTTVLLSFLQITSNYDHLIISINPQSIAENPKLYYNLIRKNLTIINSEDILNKFNSEYIIVGGEFNDQLFGVDFIKKYIMLHGIKELKSNYTPTKIINFLQTFDISHDAATKWFELLQQNIMIHAHGCVNTVLDFFWWFNFTHKWQHIYYRSIISSSNKINHDFLNNYYHQFFITDEFQLWSMNNPDKKIGNSWSEYKLSAKQFILSYTNDSDYFNYKCKRGSLYYIMRQRYSFVALDNRFNYLNSIIEDDYYQSNNSFK